MRGLGHTAPGGSWPAELRGGGPADVHGPGGAPNLAGGCDMGSEAGADVVSTLGFWLNLCRNGQLGFVHPPGWVSK